MSFRRSLRWFFWLLGLIIGLITAIAFAFAKRLVNPPRLPLWATPGDLGLDYDEIQFPAQDGVRISGWFVPAKADSMRKRATIILIHGWPWNRLGEVADDLFSELTGRKPVDMLRLAFALHQDGYNVLMYDMRNHGESAAAPPITFGQEEAKDLLGALTYLNARTDVDPERIGAIGFSMGANSLIYALPQTEQIKAAIAVQPTTVSVYNQKYGQDLLGPLSVAVMPLAELMFQIAGGMYFSAYCPSFAAAGAGDTPVLFIQGNSDPWGDAEDVAQIAEA
ncbi:MAG: alpha/beta hydrolase, partial [Chloroflexi bacterium]